MVSVNPCYCTCPYCALTICIELLLGTNCLLTNGSQSPHKALLPPDSPLANDCVTTLVKWLQTPLYPHLLGDCATGIAKWLSSPLVNGRNTDLVW